MTTRRPEEMTPKDPLPGEAELSRVYRAGGKVAPPAALDAEILAEARRAVAKPAARAAFASRWVVPLSTAAVMVLSLGILLVVSEQSPLDRRDEIAPMVSEPPVVSTSGERQASPALSTEQIGTKMQSHSLADSASPLPSRERAEEESRKNSASPPPQPAPIQGAEVARPAPGAIAPKGSEVVGRTERPESTPGADSLLRAAPLAEEAKKLEGVTTGAAASAARRAKIADERVLGAAQDKDPAKAKLAKEANVRIAAEVISVQVSGAPGEYQFNVTVQSPDTGCAQYADWWEVVSTDGTLLYRRVLAHSHVNEQPFTRSGGPVAVQTDTIVWVRAHMNVSGYGGTALKGSVKNGFAKSEPPANFAASLTKQSPLPDSCAF